MPLRAQKPRRATAADADAVAALLHAFNTEFDTFSPGVAVLAPRLRRLLSAGSTFAVVAGEPMVGIALVTLRSNVWFNGPVALLDEMYVAPAHRGVGTGSAVLRAAIDLTRQAGAELMEINVDEGDTRAQNFYERHGFSVLEPDTGERALYYSRVVTRD